MDLETFQRLSEQLATGKISNIEFLEVLRQFSDAFKPQDNANREEKTKMLAVLDSLIEKVKTSEAMELEDLAGQVQDWLDNPRSFKAGK